MTEKKSNPPEIPQIEELLRTIQPVPGKSFHQKINMAPWNNIRPKHEGVFQMKRFYPIMATLAIVLVLLIGFAFTPAGRVLADEIIHFFNPAAGNTFPLSPEEVTVPQPSSTPEPTYAANLLPAEQVMPEEPKPTPEPDLNLSVEQMQSVDSMTALYLMDFRLSAPEYLPEGYQLERISYDDSQQVMQMIYLSVEKPDGQRIQIYQGEKRTTDPLDSDIRMDQIQVGGNQADLVSRATEKDPYLLRWQDHGVEFTIQTSENCIQANELIQIAESISDCGEQEYTCQVHQTSTAAGFIPQQFPQAPTGLSFNNSYYSPSLTAIWYRGTAGELGLLQSSQDFTSRESSEWFSVPEEAVQKVEVGGQSAEYVNGSFINYAGEDHATWSPDSGQIRLRWKNGEYWFEIVKWGEPTMEPQELADLAGSLVADPENVDQDAQMNSGMSESNPIYDSVAAAQKDANIKIMAPTILPEGLPFSHARVSDGGGAMLFYGSFAPDYLHANGPTLIAYEGRPTEIDIEAVNANYPPEALKKVKVHDTDALIIRGTIFTNPPDGSGPQWIRGTEIINLTWETDNTIYSLVFDPLDSGERLSSTDLIQIAESMQ